jgi:SagB-type dehydrogenase family enzyme
LPEISLKTEVLSRVELEFPLIWRTHEAANLEDPAAVSALRAGARADAAPWWPSGGEPIAAVIERRMSGRRFGPGEITRSQMDVLMAAATAPAGLDVAGGGLVETYVLVHAAEGLAAGVYQARPHGLAPVRAADSRSEAAALALDQPAAGEAAVNFYFVTSMGAMETRFGDRGYRAAQLEAGVRCGRVYLAATAIGLRATGLTFYDDEVVGALGLQAEDAVVLTLVVVGR